MNVYRILPQINEKSGGSIAIGVFDGLHLGHQSVIEASHRKASEYGLYSGVFTFSFSGARPAAKPAAKRLLSDSLFETTLSDMGIDKVFRPDFTSLRGLSPEEFLHDILIRGLRAKVVACGENFHFGKDAGASALDLQRLGSQVGVEVIILPMVQQEGLSISATRIREYVAQGKIALANQMLGRPYAIDFEVVHGNRIGRTIGSPTINQPFPADFAIPKFGVYVSLAWVEQTRYIGVTNIGVKPTVGSDTPLAETYIHGFSGDLYGKQVRVELLRFLRAEKKFSSINQLREQIMLDNQEAIRFGEEYLEEKKEEIPGNDCKLSGFLL